MKTIDLFLKFIIFIFLNLVLIFLIITFSWSLLLEFSYSNKLANDNADRIQFISKGMMPYEVIYIMGIPERIEVGNGASIDYIRSDDSFHRYTVRFNEIGNVIQVVR
jgi:hypothetical protein